MHLRYLIVLLTSIAAQAQPPEMSPSWSGTWTENPSKSSIFVPGTLLVTARPGDAYLFVELGGEQTTLYCASEPKSKQPCLHLTEPQPSRKRSHRSGVECMLNARGTELEVDHWRIVPDGERLTDTDLYSRSVAGSGFAGKWLKVLSREAPTTYRISVNQARMTISIPNGELHIEFSLSQAESPKGAYVSLGPGRGNRYKILGASKLQEESLRRSRIVAHGVITLSADGNTITEEHTDVGPLVHPLHIVFDRR